MYGHMTTSAILCNSIAACGGDDRESVIWCGGVVAAERHRLSGGCVWWGAGDTCKTRIYDCEPCTRCIIWYNRARDIQQRRPPMPPPPPSRDRRPPLLLISQPATDVRACCKYRMIHQACSLQFFFFHLTVYNIWIRSRR